MTLQRKTFNLTGFILFLVFLLTALLADWIAPHDPWERFEPFASPDANHLLGTNDMGYDLLSELIFGTRVSLLVGFGAAFLATGIGLLLGLTAGYFRGATDEIIMGITDIFLMLPRIPLIIILAAFLRPSYGLIALVIGALWWTSTARLVRSKTLQVRETNFVLSSRCLGFSWTHIILFDIYPNIRHIVGPKFMITVAAAMISEASIAFLGLGDPAVKSWGNMLHFAFSRGGFSNEMWWWFIPPGLCISLVVSAVLLTGFALEKEEFQIMGMEG